MKYFSPNWNAINKSIAAGELQELREEQRALSKKIQDKIDAAYKAKRQKEELDKIAALKSLPVGATVFYTSRSTEIKFGEELKKVRDGRTRIVVETLAGKRWSVYYTSIKIQEITSDERVSHNVQTKISNLLSNNP